MICLMCIMIANLKQKEEFQMKKKKMIISYLVLAAQIAITRIISFKAWVTKLNLTKKCLPLMCGKSQNLPLVKCLTLKWGLWWTWTNNLRSKK